MKNLLQTFIAIAIGISATTSYAGVDCCSHKVLNIYQGGEHGTILFAGAKMDGTES